MNIRLDLSAVMLQSMKFGGCSVLGHMSIYANKETHGWA
uniref:Uncharacterized protein n=2 Tax=Brassica TaxID=3705 RepID=A0A3P6CPH5_BRACM|nr:unnamed protein product [Brassica rapa]